MKPRVLILGSGNIGIDLLLKILKDNAFEVACVAGIDPESKGLQLTSEYGVRVSSKGIGVLDELGQIDAVFDATSAAAHLKHAEILLARGILCIDLTPAAVGPFLVPAVNLGEHLESENVNMVTCGGQATIPMIAAVSDVTTVSYAEIVATISSDSAGPGTRANIDEFTVTTARGIREIGRAEKSKAIIILNPAEPPILMRNTIFILAETSGREDQIRESLYRKLDVIKSYVPGYRFKSAPLFEDDKITLMIEVEGEGMFLPRHSGNLDIMTAAAKKAAETLLYHRRGIES